MTTYKLCYVTAFLDIGRGDWEKFERSFQFYLDSFIHLSNIFRNMKDNRANYHLVVYIDKRCSEKVLESVKRIENVEVIEIDEPFMLERIPTWRKLNREEEIMKSEQYTKLMTAVGRINYPEHNNPKYTLINHAKVDFVADAIKTHPDIPYFCWVDFGYFALDTGSYAGKTRVCDRPLDLNRFDLTKINYVLLNELTKEDSDVLYTLTQAPERIGGFFFLGNRKNLLEYQELFHMIHDAFQKANIADDDQHIALQSFFHRPNWFCLHKLLEWHTILAKYQCASDAIPKPSLTEIMNRNGSDKGSGHHNYTEYYSKLFEDRREEKLNVLEFGIGTNNPGIPSSMCGTPGGYKPGSSLRGWAEYFPNAFIYGCDVDKDILFEDNRISTFYVDQTNPDVIQKEIVEKDRLYDIIIDDGLHHFPTNWAVLKQSFCKLNKGGIYVIEDILDFNPGISTDPFLKEIEFRYYRVPNPKNDADNNIVVARHSGFPIPDL